MGLDLVQQQQIFHLIQGLAQRHTVLLSTHHFQEAVTLCNRLLLLHHGKMIFFGTTEELRQKNPHCDPSSLEEIFMGLIRQQELL
jgi:ABC-2 type transport system ATP-binding protein